MSSRSKKSGAPVEKVFETLGEKISAFASPIRLKMIHALSQAPRSVEELAGLIGESVANTSRHLQRMARAHLVICEKRGLSRIYRLSSPTVQSIWEKLQELGHELESELNRTEDLLTDSSLKAVESVREILSRVRESQAVLLDVRENDEFAFSGVRGARCLPADQILKEGSLEDLGLRKDLPIYVYCKGRYCPLATDVVRTLRARGFEAYRLNTSPFVLKLAQADEGN